MILVGTALKYFDMIHRQSIHHVHGECLYRHGAPCAIRVTQGVSCLWHSELLPRVGAAALAAFTSMFTNFPRCLPATLSTSLHDEYVRKHLFVQVMMNSNPMYSQQQQEMRGGSVTLSNSGGSISRGQQSARGQYQCINPGQVILASLACRVSVADN